jgi:hypothetical protein
MEALLGRIRERLPQIEELLVEIADDWGEEDGVYGFYDQSFKVFGLQQVTKKAFKLIEEMTQSIFGTSIFDVPPERHN